MSRLKICMVTSSYPRNSIDFAGVFVRSLAEHVAAQGHEVHVLAAQDPEVRQYRSYSRVVTHYFSYAWPKSLQIVGYGRTLQSDVEFKKLALIAAPLYMISGTIHLLALLKRKRFDVIHSQWAVPAGPISAVASQLTGTPLVSSLHGSDVYLMEKNRVVRNAAVRSLSTARTVTACSDDLMNRVVATGVPKAKVVVLPYGVDIGVFSGGSVDGNATDMLRGNLLGSDGKLLVLGLGRLVQKKGFEYLIKAIPAIVDSMPSARFAIAGEGDDKDKLVTLARELKVDRFVVFPGAVPWHSVPSHLAACDVFVVPSVRDEHGNIDGLPNVLLEAMASQKPIVASAIAGIPSVVRDGVEGYLVDEKSPDKLSEAILKLLSSASLREDMARNARQRVVESFTWPAIAARMCTIYREVLAG